MTNQSSVNVESGRGFTFKRVLAQQIEQTTPDLVPVSTQIQRRNMVNIGPIQPKGGARELIFCLGLTVWHISLKIGRNVEGIISKYLD